jgi:hypothetical protein
MCSYLNSINLIRYLLVWRVNSSLVYLPQCLSPEISAVLGTVIAERFPTGEARDWRKAMGVWSEYLSNTRQMSKRVPQASWPVDAAIFAYPGKRTYGQGELILWELKLFGTSADHGLFLEIILPAMEEASYTSDTRWNRPNRLWGRFDIDSVYVARGSRWEPLVTNGRLDLRYRVSPVQWAEGLTPGSVSEDKFSTATRLTWITPFDLDDTFEEEGKKKGKSSIKAPDLRRILEALIARLNLLIPGLSDDPGEASDSEEQPSIRDAIKQADSVSILHKSLKATSKGCPGRYIGTQIFSCVPFPVIPYLELASILHIGKQIHFGCGTFLLSTRTEAP